MVVSFEGIDSYNKFGNRRTNLERLIQVGLHQVVFIPIRHCTLIIHRQTRQLIFAEKVSYEPLSVSDNSFIQKGHLHIGFSLMRELYRMMLGVHVV